MLWLSDTSNINLLENHSDNYCKLLFTRLFFLLQLQKQTISKTDGLTPFHKIFLWTRVVAFKHQRTSNGWLCERFLFFIQNAVAVLDGLYISKHSQLDTTVNFINNKTGCFCSIFLTPLRQQFSKYLEKKNILPAFTKENK